MGHFVLQMAYAHRTHRAGIRWRKTRGPLSRLPSVDIVVTSYNEDPDALGECLDSLVAQDYPGEVNVYVVDDASANRPELDPVFSTSACSRTGTSCSRPGTAESGRLRISRTNAVKARSW